MAPAILVKGLTCNLCSLIADGDVPDNAADRPNRTLRQLRRYGLRADWYPITWRRPDNWIGSVRSRFTCGIASE